MSSALTCNLSTSAQKRKHSTFFFHIHTHASLHFQISQVLTAAEKRLPLMRTRHFWRVAISGGKWQLSSKSSTAAGSPSVSLITQQHPRSSSAPGSSYRSGIDYISGSILDSMFPRGPCRYVKLKPRHFNAHLGAIFREIVL